MTSRNGLIAALALCLVAATEAQAKIDCWAEEEIASTADNLPVTHPSVASVRRTAREIASKFRGISELEDLPRSRLRTKWQLAGLVEALPARGFHMQIREHGESFWRPNCTLDKNADRKEPRASIVLIANAIEGFFDGRPLISDGTLTAWPEPPSDGSVRGWTKYYDGKFVFTKTGRVPWVPVTTEEYLAAVERDLQQREAEDARVKAKIGDPRTAIEDQYQKLLKTAGREVADAARAAALADLDARERREARVRGSSGTPSMLETVRAFRRTLTAADLAQQARMGYDGRQPDVPKERLPLLVKADPKFPWNQKQPGQLQVLVMHVQGSGEFAEPMARVLASIDFKWLNSTVGGEK